MSKCGGGEGVNERQSLKKGVEGGGGGGVGWRLKPDNRHISMFS